MNATSYINLKKGVRL